MREVLGRELCDIAELFCADQRNRRVLESADRVSTVVEVRVVCCHFERAGTRRRLPRRTALAHGRFPAKAPALFPVHTTSTANGAIASATHIARPYLTDYTYHGRTPDFSGCPSMDYDCRCCWHHHYWNDIWCRAED